MTSSHLLAVFALAPLTAGQLRCLAPHLSAELPLRATLASRPDLPADLANTLARDPQPSVRARAVRRATDPELIAAGIASPSSLAPALSNPAAPPAVLESFLKNPDVPNGARLRAACNPSTPEHARRAVLTPKVAAQLTHMASPHGARVVRACELVLANPFLEDSAEKLSLDLQRAVCALPGVSAELLGRFAHRRGVWVSLRNHPAAAGVDTTAATVDHLLALGSAASDITVLGRPELDTAQASKLLSRTPDAEPHVLGRALRRFGPALFATSDHPPRLASTRASTASYVEPLFGTLATADPVGLARAASTAAILGADPDAWAVFLRLADTTLSLEWTALARASVGI